MTPTKELEQLLIELRDHGLQMGQFSHLHARIQASIKHLAELRASDDEVLCDVCQKPVAEIRCEACSLRTYPVFELETEIRCLTARLEVAREAYEKAKTAKPSRCSNCGAPEADHPNRGYALTKNGTLECLKFTN